MLAEELGLVVAGDGLERLVDVGQVSLGVERVDRVGEHVEDALVARERPLAFHQRLTGSSRRDGLCDRPRQFDEHVGLGLAELVVRGGVDEEDAEHAVVVNERDREQLPVGGRHRRGRTGSVGRRDVSVRHSVTTGCHGGRLNTCLGTAHTVCDERPVVVGEVECRPPQRVAPTGTPVVGDGRRLGVVLAEPRALVGCRVGQRLTDAVTDLCDRRRTDEFALSGSDDVGDLLEPLGLADRPLPRDRVANAVREHFVAVATGTFLEVIGDTGGDGLARDLLASLAGEEDEGHPRVRRPDAFE